MPELAGGTSSATRSSDRVHHGRSRLKRWPGGTRCMGVRAARCRLRIPASRESGRRARPTHDGPAVVARVTVRGLADGSTAWRRRSAVGRPGTSTWRCASRRTWRWPAFRGPARAGAPDREHPFVETLWHHRMLALYRAGRAAEAIRISHRLRRLLAEELGVDPSSQVSTLEGRILAQDPGLQWRHPRWPPPCRCRRPRSSGGSRNWRR